MVRLSLIVVILSLLAAPAYADRDAPVLLAQVGGFPPFGSCTPSAYTGPGDIVSGATAWYGLRAYGKAQASGNTKSLNVKRASDNAAADILILCNGNLDIASANGFAGTDATCTGTISGTTLSVSSCASGTLHIHDPISGAGITGPAFITAIGTCASPPGTCTLNASQSVAVGETITAQVANGINKWYDQSGNAADQPVVSAGFAYLIPNCIGSLPCAWFDTSIPSLYLQATVTSAIFVSWSGIANQAGSPVTGGDVLSAFATGGNQPIGLAFETTANRAYIASSTVLAAVATNNAWHALNNVVGTSAVINVDGTETSGNSGAPTASTAIEIGADPNTGNTNKLVNTYVFEAGVWTATFSSANRTAICHNQAAYAGAAISASC